jgi:Zn-dependent M28 family amino/carboxypeptidase
MEETIVRRLQRLFPENAAREAELKTMFKEAGCPDDHIEEQQVRRNDPPNVICTLPGASNSFIIVGGHFDHASEGTGAVDDWSGASLLPSLYEALKDVPRRHTIIFIGFTDEERDRAGSGYYVNHLPKGQSSKIRAMVNLECLGVKTTEVWAHHADGDLLHDLLVVTQSMHAKLTAMNVERFGAMDDADSFRSRGVPVITLHSLDEDTWRILHSRRDSLKAIHIDDLYDSYRVTAEYLAYIDAVTK